MHVRFAAERLDDRVHVPHPSRVVKKMLESLKITATFGAGVATARSVDRRPGMLRADQLSPPSVVVTMPPESPTAIPFFASENETQFMRVLLPAEQPTNFQD
ncbi:MAG: hypothetical protein IPP94_05040 [Ignavibacteria bacterium]|nr:hypothetical protein [Ignavibacteria bacterium]